MSEELIVNNQHQQGLNSHDKQPIEEDCDDVDEEAVAAEDEPCPTSHAI
jgi:hypothetical protein